MSGLGGGFVSHHIHMVSKKLSLKRQISEQSGLRLLSLLFYNNFQTQVIIFQGQMEVKGAKRCQTVQTIQNRGKVGSNGLKLEQTGLNSAKQDRTGSNQGIIGPNWAEWGQTLFHNPYPLYLIHYPLSSIPFPLSFIPFP